MAKKNEEKVIEETVVATPVKESAKTIFPVTDVDGRIVRTYSVEIHGEDAEKLANQFATKIKGNVL